MKASKKMTIAIWAHFAGFLGAELACVILESSTGCWVIGICAVIIESTLTVWRSLFRARERV